MRQNSSTADRAGFATWSLALIAAAALGFLVAVYDWFLACGINHTIGAGIVLVSTAIMLLAAVAVGLLAMPGWLRILLLIGLGLDAACTARS